MRIIAYSATPTDNQVSLACSDGRTLVTNDCYHLITYLLEPCDFAVVYGLDEFVNTIAPLFPKEAQETLSGGGKYLLPQNEKLYYQPNRVLGITYAGRETNVYGLSRYADEPITDPKALEDLAHKVVKAFQSFGVNATKLTSPVAVYAEKLAKIPFPRSCDLPESALDMTNECAEIMTQEWREVYKLGHWNENEVTDYDLSSAYPSLIAKLPDLTYATFFDSPTMPSECSWGILKGNITVVKEVTPFVPTGDSSYRKGTFPTKITTDQLWLLKKYGGAFQLEHGWFFQLPKFYHFPFQTTMGHLHRMKSHEEKMVAKEAKAISVGIYGRLAQRYDNGKLGKDFNSIYALMTTSRCIVKVADFIYRHKFDDRVISITVDGTLIEGERIQLPESKEMGTWRANSPSPAIVLSVLYQWLGDKHPNGRYYADMIDMINKNPKSSVYGDIDLNLLTYGREFKELPKTGGDLLGNKYTSTCLECRH